MMKRALYIFTLLSMLAGKHSCSAQVVDSAGIVHTLSRCWRVIGHELSDIYALEEEEIKNYSMQNVCFTRDSIRMFSSVLNAPKYTIRKVNAEEYTKANFDCSKNKLAILTDSIYQVTISSVTRPSQTGNSYKMTNVIAFDDDFIYVVVDGVIFKLFATDRKTESKGAR